MVENKSKIMLVDDETSVRETIASYFAIKGYEVLSAESGEKALPIIIEKKPDVILLDLNLGGGMTGLDLLKLVREFNKTVKVIMVTGVSENLKEKLEFGGLGISDFLQKPITVSKLKEVVAKGLAEQAGGK